MGELVEWIVFGVLVFVLVKLYESFWWAKIILALCGIGLLSVLSLAGIYLAIKSISQGHYFIATAQVGISGFLFIPTYVALQHFLRWYKRIIPNKGSGD